MYFDNNKLKFKDYKFKVLNKFFFQDILDIGEMSSLSKLERINLENELTSENENLKNIKSIIPIKTGAGTNISRVAQKMVQHSQNYKVDDFTEGFLRFCTNLHFDLVKLLFDKESNTWKALFLLKDGKKIESVFMRFEDGRNSVCVSCQVGCPVGCIFCASGQMGFMRNLTSHEIVDQVLFWAKLLKSLPDDSVDKDFSKIRFKESFERVTNIVYMGMGEPMLNYDNVVESLKILTDPLQFGLGDRHITVSSSGYIPQLERFMEEKIKCRLAISLHAPNQEIRARLMPVAKIYDLSKLMEFVKKYEKYTNKRISYEYTMISGVNDTLECARALVTLLKYRNAHVNLIPMNPIAQRKDLKKSEKNTIYDFYNILHRYKIPSTIRITMGDKIKAACGQLANEN